MSTNNSQIGNTPAESIINNTDNEANIDQLLSVEIVITSQSSIQLNMTNMIPSQTPIIPNPTPNIPNLQEDEFRRRTREARRRRRQRRSERRRQQRATRRQQNNQQRRRRRRQSTEQQYEQRSHYVYQSRWERLESRERYYDMWGSDSFEDFMDAIFIEPLLEQYDLETMDPRQRRDQEHINVLEGMAALEQLALIQDELEQSKQINEVEQWQDEKQKQMNALTICEQKQLNDFERIPGPEPDELLQDQMEQLQQIATVEKCQEEILQRIDLIDQIEQEQLYQFERTPTPPPYDNRWDQKYHH
ncbi:unnamed protein product [Rotaria sp. Silwood2]|nr:unnamed protein product [Rotaria sp. Silwood2]